MWQQTVCLLQSVIVTGSFGASWDMKVSQVVSVPRGEDAVLSCSFSHPRQQDYSGKITVKWLARESHDPPFFSCSVKNQSTEELSGCSVPGLKYSLQGDPRWGELSLLIRKVRISDNGTYFCRVELDGWRNYFQGETHLYVAVRPQILSLAVIETTSGSDTTERRLQCEAEGHPLPTITWLPVQSSQVQRSQLGPDRLLSSVPYQEGDGFTCRAESVLGGAERRYPGSRALMISLIACGLVLLLLMMAGLVFCVKTRVGNGGPQGDPVTDCPADGDAELQLVYSAVSLTSPDASAISRKHQQEDSGVVYSTVNVQL